MIALLKGRIEGLGVGWAVIDVNGVGYLVFCSSRTLGQLNVGEAATVHVETHVREDHIHLYGFLDVGRTRVVQVADHCARRRCEGGVGDFVGAVVR